MTRRLPDDDTRAAWVFLAVLAGVPATWGLTALVWLIIK